MKKICFVVTVESAITAFLHNHLRALSKQYEVTVVVNTKNNQLLVQQSIFGILKPLNIARNIDFQADFKCLLQLIHFFRQQKFDAVHSVTPKAGLLAMLAAWLAGVPHRTHTFTGQVWATKTGLKRFFLKQFDCLIAGLATHNIVDSPSQLTFLLGENVINFQKALVFNQGSISGVDVNQFKSNFVKKAEIRQALNISIDAIVFLFLGRLTLDKGVLDLAHAFNQVDQANVHLVFVGPDEQNITQKIKDLTVLKSQFCHYVSYTTNPQDYMAAADVLCLPSYREGFGSVIIEAAACGVPAIASRIYGVTDAVVDNVTGLLHTPKNVAEIAEKLNVLAVNHALRTQLGDNARKRAMADFDSRLLTESWVAYYQGMLKDVA